MKSPLFGHFEYARLNNKIKFDLEDYIFIINLRENKDLDLDTLFELAYSFAKKHQQKMKAFSSKPNFQDFGVTNNFLHDSSYFAAIKERVDFTDQDEDEDFDADFDIPERTGASDESYETEIEEEEFDEDDNFSVLVPRRDRDGELFFLEPASIIKPIRILKYKFKRPKHDKFNYRNWRPTNFTLESHESNISQTPSKKLLGRGYFYAYDPSTTFGYEFLNSFYGADGFFFPTNPYFRLIRTVRYSQRSSIRRRYRVEFRPEKDRTKLRKRRHGRRFIHQLQRKYEKKQHEDEFDVVFDEFFLNFESYPSGTLISLISKYIKQFSTDTIFPDWFSTLIIFNLIFFISDYVTIFLYWYFPFVLNFFSFELAGLTRSYNIYVFYFIFIAIFIFFIFTFNKFFRENILYKFYIFFVALTIIFLSFFFFIFPFSIFLTIFFIAFFFIIIINFFFYSYKNAFATKKQFFFLFTINSEAIFGFYRANFYFSIHPKRFSNEIFFRKFIRFQTFLDQNSRFRAFFFYPSKTCRRSQIVQLSTSSTIVPPNISSPFYFPNTVSDFSFQTSIESRVAPPPHYPLLLEDEVPYNDHGAYNVGVTTSRQYLNRPYFDYQTAPESPSPDSRDSTSYQALFETENDWGSFDDETAASHPQGYWYPLNHVFSSSAIAIYHPYTIMHSSVLPFYEYYVLKVFLNSLQTHTKSNSQTSISLFSNFVKIKFLSSSFFFQNFEIQSSFKEIFKIFQKHKFFYYFLIIVYTFIIILYYWLSIVFSLFKNESNSSNFFRFIFSPTPKSYFVFSKLYKKQLKFNNSNFKSFGSIFFTFFFLNIITFFFPNSNYYKRIQKLSRSFINFFFHFLFMRYSRKNIVINSADEFLRVHQAPITISYMWNFGVYSLVCLIIQIVTGILLAGYYVPHPDFAFDSVEKIMRDINYGWLFRYMHSNGASFFFIAVYIHMFRGLYYTSFIDEKKPVWLSGAVIFFLIILTAFLGYVLPWGQISYWGAIVITNFLSAVPKIGSSLVIWVWGGYSITAVTLIRFFALHFTLPFIIALLVGVHLVYLHKSGHNNPNGQDLSTDGTAFFPYFITKDLLGLWGFISIYLVFVFFFPNYLGHADNYIKANPLVTPSHIVPEWYFLPFYAILRSIPDKLFGVLALLASIACIFALPFIFKTNVVAIANRPYSQILFFWFFVNSLFLGWIGNQPAQFPYTFVGALATIFYFLYFIILGPFFIFKENEENPHIKAAIEFYNANRRL